MREPSLTGKNNPDPEKPGTSHSVKPGFESQPSLAERSSRQNGRQKPSLPPVPHPCRKDTVNREPVRPSQSSATGHRRRTHFRRKKPPPPLYLQPRCGRKEVCDLGGAEVLVGEKLQPLQTRRQPLVGRPAQPSQTRRCA